MRRSKAPLALMEQMVMLLVFALAAALCLQAFVKSDQLSRRAEARDRAALVCQSAAEVIRRGGGDLAWAAERLDLPYGAYEGEGLAFEAHYDKDWTLSQTREYTYCLRAEQIPSGVAGLGTARVWVEQTGQAGGPLFELETAWQTEIETGETAQGEVGEHG